MGEGFGRRVVPTSIDADIDASDSWRQWARDRGATFGGSDNKRRLVEKLLIDRGVYPHIAQQIAYEIDPDAFYMVEIYGYKGSDPNDETPYGELPVKQAAYVGSGERLWDRLVGYATVAQIEHVDVVELAYGVLDRPLWDADSVVTTEGIRVTGHGNAGAWIKTANDRKKAGRPKKSGGGMTADQRRKRDKSHTAAIKRMTATQKRIDALRRSGDKAGAKRLERLSQSRRKVIK